MNIFITCPFYTEDLLETELQQLGISGILRTHGGVSCTAELTDIYRVLYYCRIAGHVYIEIENMGHISTSDQLYAAVKNIPWEEHIDLHSTFAVFSSGGTEEIRDARYAALVTKDAIADRFRKTKGKRPDADPRNPDVSVFVRIEREHSAVYIDASGDSLHKRGYRAQSTEAPLKENTAAALLLRSDWPKIAAAGGELVDPMCGSGTLCIEGALMALEIPPGVFRPRFGVEGWKKHNRSIWNPVRRDALASYDKAVSEKTRIKITGYDKSPRAVTAARENLQVAGLEGIVHIEKRDISVATPRGKGGISTGQNAGDDSSGGNGPASGSSIPGLVAVNPPYGKRLESESGFEKLSHLYQMLGEQLFNSFPGWQAAVITDSAELSKRTGIRAEKVNKLYNGRIKCSLVTAPLDNKHQYGKKAEFRYASSEEELSEGAKMFANRLKKNRKALKKWRKKHGITCYRVYDADMPEYSAAIDVYEDTYLHVQEYAPPKTIPEKDARRRLNELLTPLPLIFGIKPEHIFLKQRRPQSRDDQYGRSAAEGSFYTVHEGECVFLVNFTDYIDTGLFLDFRNVRSLIQQESPGKKMLNLFSYTATAGVYAALGGAKTTVNVDSSRNYHNWAKKNYQSNNIPLEEHRFIEEDCMQWLKNNNEQFDVILADPPTFSNSKDRQDFFIEKHYPLLLEKAINMLKPGGKLFFSSHYRTFKPSFPEFSGITVRELTEQTRPYDFARNKHIHRVWLFHKE